MSKPKILIYDIPVRRYAIFTDLIYGEQMTVVYGEDIHRAPKWGGFVKWFGGVKPAVKIYSKGSTYEKAARQGCAEQC